MEDDIVPPVDLERLAMTTRWERLVSAVGGRRVIVALGVLYVTLGAGHAIRNIAMGGSLIGAVSDLVIVGIPGLLILYIGYRLPAAGLHPDRYPRIVGWSLGGFGLLLSVVGLRILSPGVTIDDPLWSVALATAIGTFAGLVIGMNEARAKELQRTKDRLNDTVERLETSNELLDQFAYAASHDLQEPLRMISSHLLLIERRSGDDLNEESEEYLDFAVERADRMREMIDGLLEYSRIETADDVFEPVNLDSVVEDVLADIQLQIEENDAEIDVEELPPVEGDESQLHQVFQNLLSNAIEYSGDEPPRVHVSAERNGTEWTVSVRDEGIGIDPDEVDRIFQVFERLNPDENEGTGIGLTLCKRIVERHGGEIRVDSEPGEGATFTFTLPATEEWTDE